MILLQFFLSRWVHWLFVTYCVTRDQYFIIFLCSSQHNDHICSALPLSDCLKDGRTNVSLNFTQLKNFLLHVWDIFLIVVSSVTYFSSPLLVSALDFSIGHCFISRYLERRNCYMDAEITNIVLDYISVIV